jgi:hypothetical protein
MSSGKLTFLHEPNEKETPAFRKRRRSHPSEDAAPTPTGFAEIVSDDFPLLHAAPTAVLSRRWRTLPCGKPLDGIRILSRSPRSLLFDFSRRAAKCVASHARK